MICPILDLHSLEWPAQSWWEVVSSFHGWLRPGSGLAPTVKVRAPSKEAPTRQRRGRRISGSCKTSRSTRLGVFSSCPEVPKESPRLCPTWIDRAFEACAAVNGSSRWHRRFITQPCGHQYGRFPQETRVHSHVCDSLFFFICSLVRYVDASQRPATTTRILSAVRRPKKKTFIRTLFSGSSTFSCENVKVPAKRIVKTFLSLSLTLLTYGGTFTDFFFVHALMVSNVRDTESSASL